MKWTLFWLKLTIYGLLAVIFSVEIQKIWKFFLQGGPQSYDLSFILNSITCPKILLLLVSWNMGCSPHIFNPTV